MLTFERGTVLVAGGGGFLGGHLVRALLPLGYREVRAVDVRPLAEWDQLHPEASNVCLDLRDADQASRAVRGAAEIFNLAVRRGALTENVLMNTNLLLSADEEGAARYTLASGVPDHSPTRWELFAERTCHAFRAEFGLATRIARLHPVYGPHDRRRGAEVWSPAALCRAVLEARDTGRPIVLPGDGHETACFTFVDDCVAGLLRVHAGACAEPVELGGCEPVSTHGLVNRIEDLAGVRLERVFVGLGPLAAAAGANGLRRRPAELDWSPTTSLEVGLRRTFEWVLAERGNALPEPANAMPERANAMPERANAMPERANAMPERGNAPAAPAPALPGLGRVPAGGSTEARPGADPRPGESLGPDPEELRSSHAAPD